MDKKQLFNCSNDTVHAKKTSTDVQIFQNFMLLWLNTNIHEDSNSKEVAQLRQVIHNVNTFADINHLVDFITNIKDVKIFMICSQEFAKAAVPIIHDMHQISSIYILADNKSEYEQWSKQWTKIRGILTEVSSIFEMLKKATRECDQNYIPMSFLPKNDGILKKDLNQLDQSFMYTQIFKEILLTIDFDQQHIKEFTRFCREKFSDNIASLENIDKFEKEYDRYSPIWWYSQSFLYSILNRGLRTMEVSIIIKMGFFVHHLHQCIKQLHDEQYVNSCQLHSLTVYRGQGLTQIDFDQMVKTKGGLLSFNSFLSTSLDREVALAFADSNQNDPDIIGILFQITLNPSISLIPFADISDMSHYSTEKEILFSMHSVFRIGDIKQINGNNRLWEVELKLTSDNDPQLSILTEYIRKMTVPHLTGWYRLGQLLIQLGHINQAQQLYEILLDQTSDEFKRGLIHNQIGSIKHDKSNYEEAIISYEKSIEIRRKYPRASNPLDLISTYNNIGLTYDAMGDYSRALSHYERVFKMRQEILPENHSDIVNSLTCLGLMYEKLGKYTEALSFHEKNLKISQKIFHSNHPELANAYSSIGSVYNMKGEYSKAFPYCKESHEIRLKILPPDHPDLAISYNNIGFIHMQTKGYPQARISFEKALDIYRKTLSPDNPRLAKTYLNIGWANEKNNKFSKALSYYEKASEIFEKTPPGNHPDLSTTYGCIGGIHLKKGEYSKAFSFYKRSLEIAIRCLPPDHPDIGTLYIAIAFIYDKMREYSKAQKAYKMGMEICQKNFPFKSV